jgi:dTDP-4-amino-4,6-dideoxygalactose transaminase
LWHDDIIHFPNKHSWFRLVNSIPLLDLTQQYQSIKDEVSAVVSEVLASGQYIKGQRVQAFEQHFAQYIGTQECVACNSGTDALYLALKALKIGPGDEVITSPFTFIATAEMISAVGATPVFVDVDPQTFNLDLNLIEPALTSQTRAIIPVHLFGHPVDMTRLMAIAQAHQLWVIEDCAQAVGATWAGARVGSIGHIGCFSFYPTKNLGACGDGGAVTTHDRAIAKTMRILADHGRTGTYYHETIGINSRLDAVQAAILDIKLQHLDHWNTQRQAVAEYYRQSLEPISGLLTPVTMPHAQHVWHQYTIRLHPISTDGSDPHSSKMSTRDYIRQQFQENRISTGVYYPVPLHLQPVYRNLGHSPGQCPVAEQIAQEVLSLPMYPDLSAKQQERVVCTLKDALLPRVRVGCEGIG